MRAALLIAFVWLAVLSALVGDRLMGPLPTTDHDRLIDGEAFLTRVRYDLAFTNVTGAYEYPLGAWGRMELVDDRFFPVLLHTDAMRTGDRCIWVQTFVRLLPANGTQLFEDLACSRFNNLEIRDWLGSRVGATMIGPGRAMAWGESYAFSLLRDEPWSIRGFVGEASILTSDRTSDFVGQEIRAFNGTIEWTYFGPVTWFDLDDPENVRMRHSLGGAAR